MNPLEIIVLLPILAAIAVMLGSPARFVSLVTAGGVLVMALWFAAEFNLSSEGVGNFEFQMQSSRELLSIPGFPTLNLAFGVDGISIVLVLLTAIVLLAAVWISPKESDIKGSANLYYACVMFIAAGAMGAFCATDLFFLYAFHELALIPTFLMIGMFGHGENRLKTAWTITVYLGVGSIILLIGLIATVVSLGAGSFDLTALLAAANETPVNGEQQVWIYLPLLIGFGILVSLFPFHSWAPSAYAQAPTPVAMLHAGVLKKFGLYGLIRVANPLLPEGAEALTNVICVLLLGNIIILGLVTIAQKDLHKMLGYSSVMHMGYVFLGIVSGTTIGMIGAVLLMFAHGVSIAVLFALAGTLRRRYGALDMDRLGGLAKVIPSFGLFFGFAAFASIGLPGFANFAAEVMVFFGAFKDSSGFSGFPFNLSDFIDPTGKSTKTELWIGGLGPTQWTCIIALWGVVISAVYMLRAFRRENHPPEQIQLCTLLSIKTGGCPEDCGYCSQSVK
ncbi:MAG: NADH-quinone oxidoreductase subunit M, partial [Verrucomicrobiota bacterium]